ncbi:hypothetical protein FOL47_001541 [Perkinsus chesapeaki]|uniref:Uncharacterized protein n=1 Tax=Perkinsus chesapeaki TaxID=330153 RepID=A0A7J6KSX5_PERCH|nr:hypothetical protein FOL47_001541 [Perkinsus chesapeaki]
MYRVLEELIGVCVQVYIDDIIVYSKTESDHLKDLERVFELLEKAGLTIKLAKCHFGMRSVEFLGFTVSNGKVQPADFNVEKILKESPPKSVKGVRRFLGMTGYFRKFIKGYAHLVKPLTLLTKKDAQFVWSQECQEAYEKVLDLLVERPCLGLPDWDKTFTLETDASAYGIGAVLLQEGHPIAYASKTLSETEQEYSASEREVLAIVYFCDYFRYYLDGGKFVIRTDHEPLTFMAKQRDPHHRYARWMARLQAYDYEIEYVKGSENGVADYWSREGALASEREAMEHPASTHVLVGSIMVHQFEASSQEWKDTQDEDPGIVAIRAQVESFGDGHSFRKFHLDDVGVLRYDGKIVVPQSRRQEILRQFHDVRSAGHLGVNKMATMLFRRFYWANAKEDIREYVSSCPQCQLDKGEGVKAPFKAILNDEVFHTLQMVFAGPFMKTKRGNEYLLLVVDVCSRFPFGVPTSSKAADEVARALVEEVFPVTGLPQVIQTDNDVSFTGVLLTKMYEMMGIQGRTGPTFHPQAQGVVERLVRTIKSRLRPVLNKDLNDWDEVVPMAIMTIRQLPNEPLGVSPAKMVFGRTLRLPQDALVYQTEPIKPQARYQEAAQAYVERLRRHLKEVHQFGLQHIKQVAGKRALEHKEDMEPEEVFQVGDKVAFKRDSSTTVHGSKFQKRKFHGVYLVTKDHQTRQQYEVVSIEDDWYADGDEPYLYRLRGVRDDEELVVEEEDVCRREAHTMGIC